jgi:hypothetical protein
VWNLTGHDGKVLALAIRIVRKPIAVKNQRSAVGHFSHKIGNAYILALIFARIVRFARVFVASCNGFAGSEAWRNLQIARLRRFVIVNVRSAVCNGGSGGDAVTWHPVRFTNRGS